MRSRLLCGRTGGARCSQYQKNSTVSTPRAVMKDSTSMPSLNTTLPRMSAALNDNADVMPGSSALSLFWVAARAPVTGLSLGCRWVGLLLDLVAAGLGGRWI